MAASSLTSLRIPGTASANSWLSAQRMAKKLAYCSSMTVRWMQCGLPTRASWRSLTILTRTSLLCWFLAFAAMAHPLPMRSCSSSVPIPTPGRPSGSCPAGMYHTALFCWKGALQAPSRSRDVSPLALSPWSCHIRSNQTMELTASRRMSAFQMTKSLSLRATLGLGSGSSSCFR
jgi:hypothetical protein